MNIVGITNGYLFHLQQAFKPPLLVPKKPDV